MLSEDEKKRIDNLIKDALWKEDWEKAAKLTVALVFVETPTEKLVSVLQEATKAYKVYYELGKPMQDCLKEILKKQKTVFPKESGAAKE